MPRAPKTVSSLVSDLKLRMFWDSAADEGPYTDAEIVRVAQDLIEDEVYPAIERTCEDYLTTFVDIPLISPASYDKTPGYQAPIESMSKIVYVAHVDSNGNETPLEEYGQREWQRFGRHMYGFEKGYTQQGGRIFLNRHPTDVSNKYLRVYYVARPLKMTTAGTTSGGNTVLYPRLTADPRVNEPVTIFDVDTDVQPWESGSVLLLDSLSVLSGAAPHLAVEDYDTSSVGAAGFTAALWVTTADLWPNSGGGIPTGARAGDFLIADRETPIVQLPIEGYRLLLNGMAAEFADARGDKDKYARKRDEFTSGLEAFAAKLVPRSRDTETYVNWNSPGRTRRGSIRWR